MKRLIILTTLAVFTLFSTRTTAQFSFFNSVKGNGNVVEQTRNIDDFEGIKASTGVNVYITQADDFKVVVEADENLHKIIKTEVNSGILKVYCDESVKLAKKLDIHVSLPKLNLIKTSSGADAYTVGVFETDEIELEASSGSDIKAELVAQKVDAAVSSGADIVIEGKTDYFVGRSSSGSDIKAKELVSKYAKASASSGGDVYITVTEELEAHASSGGDVNYYGDPAKTDVSSSSGGDVNRR